jgi:arsenate reductase (thioredoxin)
MRIVLTLILLLAVSAERAASAQSANGLDTLRIEKLTGAKGALDEKEAVFTPMGLTSWAAFKRAGEHTVVMGDLRAGIDIVAIHHHMTGEEPRIVFLHYWGVGSTEGLARGLRLALDQTKHDQRASADTVVFVCEHGSVKSLMAQEWFNRLARERGVSMRAVSRGVTPDASVPAVVADYLAREGFDVRGFKPRPLAKADLGGAVRVIALGADTSSVTRAADVPVERWDDIPPAKGQYKRTSDAIRARVEVLLNTLKQQ